MQTDTAARLRNLSDKIAETESALALEWIEAGSKAPDSRDSRTRTLRSNYLCVLLRSERLLLCTDLLSRGQRSWADTFRSDWKKVTEALKYLWNDRGASSEFLSDAVELIALSEPGLRQCLLRQLDFPTRIRIRQPKHLSSRVCTDALDMVAAGLDEGLQEEVLRVIDNLVTISRNRNASLPKLHRSNVHRSLYYAADFDTELSYRICHENLPYFEDTDDLHACWFCWFYGVAALRMNQLEEAYPVLARCRELFLKNQGERSWIGIRARLLCLYRLLAEDPQSGAEAEMWDILKKIDQRYYRYMDDSADFVAAFTRTTLLGKHVDQQDMQGMLPHLELLLDYCQATADAPANSLLTIRYAENMISAYYMQMGDYLQAAHHAVLARDSLPPEGITPVPSDVLIYSNLLKLYTTLNDTDQMVDLIDRLVDLWDTFEDNDYLITEVAATINTARSKLGLSYDDEADLERAIQDLMDICHDIRNGLLEPEGNAVKDIAFYQWTIGTIASVVDETALNMEQYRCMDEIIRYFLDNPRIYPLSDAKLMSAYSVLAILHDCMGSPLAVRYADEYLRYRGALSDSNEGRIIMQRFAAIIYYKNGQPDRALTLIEETLAGVTSAWQKATAYLNDRKICQVLLMIQDTFKICCAILRALCGSETFYEQILRFKDLPALVGRERNRLLRLAPVDEALRDEIFALQDQLASAEMNNDAPEDDATGALFDLLQEKEAAFAAKFPQNLQFTPISFPAMCRRLPEGSAVAEYFFSADIGPLTEGKTGMDCLVLDLFITVNRNGVPRLIHRVLSGAEEIWEDANSFIEVLQHPEDLALAGQRELLKERLFTGLLLPAMEHLEGISTLYIAPDDVLCNLPFEILRDSQGNMLQDRFQILRLVSGRDLLFSDDCSVPSGGGFILGDPDYDADRGEHAGSAVRTEQEDDFTRSLLTRTKPVAPLPFSGVEVRRIARRFRCRAYTGKLATKYALQDALPCGLIHLATHGVFDTQSESVNSLYSSCLVFAGFNNFLETKTEAENCGNGILTADEISRMNLSGTHLVVLSACQSGLGSTEYHSTQGLLSAFSAAGVRWVISHMWRANDLSTAILMDAFYEAHLTLGMDVPDALSHAKQYLRTVTAGQLREKGWLEAFAADAGSGAQKQIDALRKAKDRKKFFADEYFWGGFVCHKCK